MNTRYQTALAIMLAVVLGSPTLQAATWTGASGNSDWFDPSNWNPPGEPGAGADVIITGGGGIQLTNSTQALASLSLTNAILTMKNWETVLQATTVTIGTGGKINHDGPHTNRRKIVLTETYEKS